MRKIRDIFRFISAILLGWTLLPHMIIAVFGGKKSLIYSDIECLKPQVSISLNNFWMLLYQLHNNTYYRTVFYHRIGVALEAIIGWWRPKDKYFKISATTKIGPAMLIAHPYSTILNAESIGSNFSCLQCTTLGSKGQERPTIGNNVSLGANVTIIGGVRIGNNVIIGAGSVVVKNIPDNSVAVGNPARVIKTI